MFFRGPGAPVARQSANRSRDIQRYNERFATTDHGLQMFNGANPLKVSKTMALLASGMVVSFGASAILSDNLLSKIFGGLVLSFVTVSIIAQQAKALGEQRRTGSNFITQAAISWGMYTNKLTRQDAEQVASSNAYFNLFNGGAKIFDDLTPPWFKSLFEDSVKQVLSDEGQERTRQPRMG